MQKSIIERISGGGLPERSLYLFIAWFIKLFKNLVPSMKIRHNLKVCQDKFFEKYNYFVPDYKYIKTEDYIKKYGINSSQYSLDNRKVYILNNFYVSFYSNTSKCIDWSIIHDKDNNILEESCPFVDLSFFKILGKKHTGLKNNNIKIVEEAIDFALMANANYWHFTITALDKILQMEDKGFPGKYMVFNKPYVREIIMLAGLPLDKFIFVNDGEMYQVKNLHVLKCDFTTDAAKVSNIDYLQKIKARVLEHLNLDNIITYPRKLYVKRIGSRKIINENELLEIMTNDGFEVMIPEEHSLEEQIKYFYAADIVVTPHGANSTNVLFMRPNTHFIECFGHAWIPPCMLMPIKVNQINYHMLVSRYYGNSSVSIKNVTDDFSIDSLMLDIILNNIKSSKINNFYAKIK